jgi:peroxiredoxin Q/BCP
MNRIASWWVCLSVLVPAFSGCGRNGTSSGGAGGRKIAMEAGSQETAPTRGKVRVGDRAPDFALRSQTGQTVSLKDFEGKSAVVLYFYPKDESPGCTAEACAFRDRYEVFKEAGAVVIGVSSDSVDSHKEFASHHNLPFLLLSDSGGKVRKRYGVARTLGLMPGRVTYVLDKKGIVRLVFSSQFSPAEHVEEALTILKTIRDEK